MCVGRRARQTLTLVLTTGLITIFILVISVIGKWLVFSVKEDMSSLTLNTHTYLRKLESWDQYGGMCG